MENEMGMLEWVSGTASPHINAVENVRRLIIDWPAKSVGITQLGLTLASQLQLGSDGSVSVSDKTTNPTRASLNQPLCHPQNPKAMCACQQQQRTSRLLGAREACCKQPPFVDCGLPITDEKV